MSRIKLDLSEFKHVRSDKHSTTLRHKQGHELTLAHNSLSPESKAQLSALSRISSEAMTQPQAQEQDYVKKQMRMAEGGDVDSSLGPNPDTDNLESNPGQLHQETRERRNQRSVNEQSMNHMATQDAKAVQRHMWDSGAEFAEGGDVDDEPDDKSKPQYDPSDDGTSNTKTLVRWEFARGGNAGEARKQLFGSSSAPANKEMRNKHIAHIKEFAKRAFGIDMHPSGGKIDQKTGKRRDNDAEVGVDKPDWRSGNLESQWNPDAMVHELAHLMLMPKGIGLKDAQQLMDKQYSEVQKKHGYMKQKRSHHEIQPMAVENLIRRHLGLPANTNSVPVKPGDGPRTAVEDGAPAANRIKKGDKELDLIRQSALLLPENRQRVEHVMAGKLKFHPEQGWQENPDAIGAKVRMMKEQAQGMPSSVMAEGGKVRPEPKPLDYNQIRKEKREMNVKEGNKSVRGGNVARYDEGGKVQAPAQTSDSPAPSQQPHDTPANVNTPSTWSELGDRVKNAWAEGGEVQRYADGTDAVAAPADTAPKRLQEPKAPIDVGGVQKIAAPNQPPSALPENPEDTSTFYALKTMHEMQNRKGKTTSQYDPATGKSHEVEVRGQIGTTPSAEDRAYADMQRNADVQAHPDRHSAMEKAAVQEQAPQIAQQVDWNNARESAKYNSPQPQDQASQQPYDNAVNPAEGSDQPLKPGDKGYDPNPQFGPPTKGVDQLPATDQLGNKGVQASQQAAQGAQGPIETNYKSTADHYQESMNQLMGHDAAHLNDVAAGHIQPKTLHDLIADKSFFGKVSSIAGLILSGAGSGLSGQPNLALAQLNQTIQNDIAAQQNSATNAQNLLRINQQGLANQAGIEDTDVGIRAKAQALTWSQLAYAAFDDMTKKVAVMPEGPDKERAQQNLAFTAQAMGAERKSVLATAAAQDAQAKAFFGNRPGSMPQNSSPQEKEAAFQNRLNMLRMSRPELAQQLQDRHVPYMEGTTSVPVSGPVSNKLTAMNTMDMQGQDLLNFAKQYEMITAKALKGEVSPMEALRIKALGAKKAHEFQSFYNGSLDGLGMTASRANWLDKQVNPDPTSLFAYITGNQAQLEEVLRANSMRKQALLQGPEVGYVPSENERQQALKQNQASTAPVVNGELPPGMIKVYNPAGVPGTMTFDQFQKAKAAGKNFRQRE